MLFSRIPSFSSQVRFRLIFAGLPITREPSGITVFAFIIGEEPTYLEIEEGNWKSEEPYAAVHRVASDGTVQGVLGHVMDYCSAQVPHIRIDTHTDNKVMQHVLEKYGFVSCGIVHVPDGSPRIAYELLP